MYLTAHRVKALKESKTGINVFLHKHSRVEIPDMSWDEPDIELVADSYPGVLVAESIDLAPGGNQVISFLDVAAEDSADVNLVEEVLGRFEGEVSDVRRPLARLLKNVGIRFGLQSGLGDQVREEYEALRRRAMDLLRTPATPAWREEPPLVVDVKIDDQGWTLSLASDSIRRMQEIHREPWKPNSVTIKHETKHEFEQMHGDMIRHIIPILTELSIEQVVALGGVCLHDRSTGRIVEWPKRVS